MLVQAQLKRKETDGTSFCSGGCWAGFTISIHTAAILICIILKISLA